MPHWNPVLQSGSWTKQMPTEHSFLYCCRPFEQNDEHAATARSVGPKPAKIESVERFHPAGRNCALSHGIQVGIPPWGSMMSKKYDLIRSFRLLAVA